MLAKKKNAPISILNKISVFAETFDIFLSHEKKNN